MTEEIVEFLHRHADRPDVIGEVLNRHRERLDRLVRYRMPPQLLDRLEPSDVIQETFLEASQRLGEYLAAPPLPFYLWLRFLALQKLAQLGRRHLQAQKRDVRRERSIGRQGMSSSSTFMLAEKLMASGTSPSGTLQKEERIAYVLRVVEQLSEQDREVLELRHFEELTIDQVAQVLGISRTAANSRYFRALKRLKELLDRDRSSL